MRLPLSMTAGMAGYIFKNKMRPKPEWQKTAAPVLEASNPFRILSAQLAEGGSREAEGQRGGDTPADHGSAEPKCP